MKKFILPLLLLGLAMPAFADPQGSGPGAVAPKLKINPNAIERPAVTALGERDALEAPEGSEICWAFECGQCREVNRSYTGTYIKSRKEAACPTRPSSCDVNSRGACAGLNDDGVAIISDPLGQ